MSESPADFKQILSLLNREKVQFVMIGGLAAIFYGNARVTFDIDICYARDRQNLEAIARVLRELKAELRVREASIPFRPDWKTLEMGLNFTLRTLHGDLDLLGEVAGVGGFNECLSEARTGVIAGSNVHILSLEKLIAAKRAAARPKDLEDLRSLETLKTMMDQRSKAKQHDKPDSQ